MRLSWITTLLPLLFLSAANGYADPAVASESQPPKTVVDYETLKKLGEEGKDLSQYELSLESLKALAEQGDDLSQYDLAHRFEMGTGGTTKNEVESVRWYRRASEQGLPMAQTRLGAMLLSGRGTKKDAKEALYWTSKAAEQGSPIAQWALGMMYKNGEGTHQDQELAFFWMKMSAERSYPSAQWTLGLMLATGLGTEVDQKAAYGWLLLAKASGKERAQTSLDILAGQLTKDQIAEAEDWAQAQLNPDSKE